MSGSVFPFGGILLFHSFWSYGLLHCAADAAVAATVTVNPTMPTQQLDGAAVGTVLTAPAALTVEELKSLANNSLPQTEMPTLKRKNEKPKDVRSGTTATKVSLRNLAQELNEGRGRHKRRKMLKYLQPLLIGVLIVKFILLPLVLKTLTALSTSSFVMSKIALAAAGLLVLKWLLTGSGDGGGGYDGGAKERTHVEIVHLPVPLTKSYHRGGGGGAGVSTLNGWNDLSLSGSSSVLAIKHMGKPNKYIPVGDVKDMAHIVAAAAVADTTNNGGNGYRNTHPVYDGKPFL
ncbi:unnamed protein product [Ceratitis capitata]|uniref:(Mediterranean fruit fly) hypothetical protein n=1 Tax=Ceratitis capitata TaxID=7213 RepID=A0A811U7A7_CERCA|nr:unnamed protein product [Ceratitis capitata]